MRIPVSVSFGSGEQTLNIEAVNVPNGTGQSYIMGSTAQTTEKFTVLLYDYTSKKTLAEATIEYGDDISFELTCPPDADTTHQLQLLFYTGEIEKTAYINSTFTNLKIEDITDEENPVKIFPMSEGDSGLTVIANDNTTVGTIDSQYRRIAVLDYSYGIFPGHKYRITMSNASYEVVNDLVTTYMQFKVTDCSKSIESGVVTDDTTTITFYIKEIWKNALGKTKEYSYRSTTFENITVYKYDKLGPSHEFNYIDASVLVDKILGLQENGIGYDNISYNGTTRALTEQLGYNLEAIYVTASVTKLGNPPSIPLRSNENRDNFNLGTYYYGITSSLDSDFKIDNWYAKILVNVRKGSSNDYFVMQAVNANANFYVCLNSLYYNVSGIISSNGREVYNASYIYNYTGSKKYNFFELTGDSELRVDLSGVGGFEGDVALFHIIGDIQKVDDNPLGTKTDTNSYVNYWKLNSEPSSVSYKIKKLGDGTNNFFKDYYVPDYLSISGNISIAANTFNNLTSTTKYYVPGYTFTKGEKVDSYDKLFNSTEIPYSFAVDVSPFNPGITPKSYEMNMYKNYDEKELYTIADYYSYDKYQIGLDSYGREG